MTMTAAEWLNIAVGDGRLMFYLEGLVEENGHKFVFQEGPAMHKPDLKVTVSNLMPDYSEIRGCILKKSGLLR
jgi:hypothetical protein